MKLVRLVYAVLECPVAMVYNEASESYLLGIKKFAQKDFYLILTANLNYFEA